MILFDDDCGFCRWSVVKLQRWDRGHRLRPLALQTEEASHLLGGMDPQTKMASWHLVTVDGRVHSAGDAVAPLARLLPAGAPIAALARTFPGATSAAYRWVTRHRDGLGRAVGQRACSVRPTEG